MRKRLPSIANTPALLAEWDWEKNAQEGRDPYTTTQGSNKKAWWRCHKGHSFQSPPNGRSSGKGCPYCSGRIAIPGENDLLTVNPQLAEEWDYSQNHTLQIERVLPYSNKRVYWICGVCGNTWQATVNNRSKGSGCPRCAKRFHSSFPEQALFYYIRKTYPDAINSYREIFSRNRELDIYIPSERIGIEYDGTYAHRISRIQKDYDKYEICKKHGIRLLRICENPTSSKVDTCDVLIACSYDYRDYSGLVRVLDELRKYLEITQDIDIERDKPFIQQQYMSVLKQSSITTVRPDLAQEWDYEKNDGLTPDMYRYTSGDRVWWRCRACQNSWRAQIYMRSQGVGCPYCANKIVVVGYNDFATRCPDLLSEWAYDKNDISPHNIVWKSSKTVWWKCNTCQRSWKTKICHRVNGSGCPFCSGRSTKIGENDISITHPHLLKEWSIHRNGTKRPEQFMAGSDAIVWWHCPKCGLEWKASIYNRTRGSGCPACAKQVLKHNEIQSRIRNRGSLRDWCESNPDIGQNLLLDWDSSKNSIQMEMLTPGTQRRAWWKCHMCGHMWEASIYSRRSGYACPRCHYK